MERAPLALVTGAGIRLGRAVAEGLAERGLRLALHYHRHREEAEELVRAVRVARPRETEPPAMSFFGDLRDPTSMEALIDDVEAAMGPVDTLVLSAAVYPRDPLESIRVDAFEETLRANLTSPFLLARSLGLRMQARGSGRIVGLLDWSVDRPYADRLPYTIAKAGLRAGLLGLARALAPQVRVNGLALGAILLPEGTSEELRERIRRAAPLERIGDPQDVVRAVHYLLDAEFITGAILPVDGGRSIA